MYSAGEVWRVRVLKFRKRSFKQEGGTMLRKNFQVAATSAVLAVLLATQAFSQNERKAFERSEVHRMTNADVIRLVKEHKPEGEILRSVTEAIQRGGASFDSSPTALIELHKAGVSDDVLKLM